MSDDQREIELSKTSSMDPQTARNVAAIAQIVSFFVPIIAPLGILIAADYEFVKDHAREALNFDIVLLIYSIIPLITGLISVLFVAAENLVVGSLLLSATFAILVFLAVVYFLYPIIGAVKACSGKKYRFPFIVRILR